MKKHSETEEPMNPNISAISSPTSSHFQTISQTQKDSTLGMSVSSPAPLCSQLERGNTSLHQTFIPVPHHRLVPEKQSLSESVLSKESYPPAQSEEQGAHESSSTKPPVLFKKVSRAASCQRKHFGQKNLTWEYRNRTLITVLKKYTLLSATSQEGSPVKSLGLSFSHLWVKILPICTMDFLDLESVIQLRQTCSRLYCKGRFGVTCCTFEKWCTLTEQEFLFNVFPQLQTFLTPQSLARLNFSHCCLLTDSFPSALMGSFVGTSFCQNLRALYFDFCYALTDKSLEVLLKTPLPCLEILSFRCARSRDLTGAPFSSKNLLTSSRWPRFHQLSCSCTQITLAHLDSVAEFLAKRAVELSVAPKLGISGSLASNSLIRRLGLEQAHHEFIDAIILGKVEGVEQACLHFEEKWAQVMNTPEVQKKVLHRLVRHRGSAILVNAPCSVAVVDDGEGREKAIWFLRYRQTASDAHVERQSHDPSTQSLYSFRECFHETDSRGLNKNPEGTSAPVYTLQNGDRTSQQSFLNKENLSDTLNPQTLHYVHYSRWSYPLPIAVRLGNLSLVEFLIRKGTYVDVWGYNFATPLYIAGSHVTSHPLDEHHFHTKSQDNSADTCFDPEHDEVRHPPLVHLCEKVKYTGMDSHGEENPCLKKSSTLETTPTPQTITGNMQKVSSPAQVQNESRLQMVYLLLKNGAPVNAPDLYSVKCPVNAAIKNDNKDLLELFLAHGATINVRALNQTVIPPLIQLSRRQQQKKHPRKGLTRLGYKSPLFVACELEAWRCVSVLLDHHADPHWRDPFSHRNLTPTLLAYRKNPSMLRLFVCKGAGKTPETRWVLSEVLAAAILHDDIQTVSYLVAKYPDLLQRESSGMWSLPLHQCSKLNRRHVAEVLLQLGSSPNATNVDNLTPLHFAASEGHQDLVELLLAYGANPNYLGGAEMNSALHLAVEENHIEAVEMLLRAKPDLTLRNAAGMTSLMVAIVSRHEKLAPTLIYSATVHDLDTVDFTKRSALMYAIHFCQFKVAALLVERGVSVHQSDSIGTTPESILKEKIHSLGKTPLSFNKFFWNLVNTYSGHTSPYTSPAEKKNKVLTADIHDSFPCVADKAQPGQASDESVRKLNAKRRKLAKKLLNKIRSRFKKSSLMPPSLSRHEAQTSVCSSSHPNTWDGKIALRPFSTSLSASQQNSESIQVSFDRQSNSNILCSVGQ